MGVKDKRQGKWTVDNLWIAESQWYQAVLILIAAGGLRRPEDEITKKQVNITDGFEDVKGRITVQKGTKFTVQWGGLYSFLDQMEKEHMAKEDESELIEFVGTESGKIQRYFQAEQRGDFNSTYICPKPEEMDRGFTSGDHFFTGEFQPDARPVHSSSDPAIDAGIIVSACESTVLRLDHNVQLHDQFWLKGQKYSLYDMLDRNETATEAFIGGTVYQAFLGPADYHRWRSPVSGTIVNEVVVPEGDPDFKPGSPYGAIIRSQSWLTQSATRAIIYIQADNPKIGLVGFIAVGMVEVSTCALAVRAGQQIEKGALVVPLWWIDPRSSLWS
ncbi:phosphatidylserine decarboxylase-domain-containing protein [Mycena olivaceomarginata]|nr:phosphatidylserine decarboxylase-domain-containing protein [Mycena olivaceomarginata]